MVSLPFPIVYRGRIVYMFVPFVLVIALSVIFRFTAAGSHFGIIKTVLTSDSEE